MTGVPLVIFLIFALLVFTLSISAGILLSLGGALITTAITACFILLPVIIFTTALACFFSVAWLFLQRFSAHRGPPHSNTPAAEKQPGTKYHEDLGTDGCNDDTYAHASSQTSPLLRDRNGKSGTEDDSRPKTVYFDQELRRQALEAGQREARRSSRPEIMPVK